MASAYFRAGENFTPGETRPVQWEFKAMSGHRTLLKAAARTVLHRLGGLAFLRRRRRADFRILMYHRFPGDLETRQSLEAQCAEFRRCYHPVSLAEIGNSVHTGQPLPPRALAITVDDGYRDFLDHGFPVFEAYGLPVTVFVVSDFLDGLSWLWTDVLSHSIACTAHTAFRWEMQPGAPPVSFTLEGKAAREAAARHLIEAAKKLPNHDRLRMVHALPELLEVALPPRPPAPYQPLHWDEVRELAGRGVEFGAHTKTHPILARMERDGQRFEIEHSKRRLEQELGAQVLHFCYPNGGPDDFDQTTVGCVAASGFRTATTTTPGLNRAGADPWLLKRFGMEPGSPLDFALERVEGLHDEWVR